MKYAKIAIILLSVLIFSCSKKDPNQELEKIIKANADTHINQFILDKFKDHRIIMIGDAGHGQGIYERNVTSFLNDWLKAIENGNTSVKNLVLVLEADSLDIQRRIKYANSLDYRDILSERPLYSMLTSTADLEFFWTLGNFLTKVDEINANGNKVKFDILGPEMIIDLNNWSHTKGDSFFIQSRDSISSNAIINYLEDNPDSRALIFYGEGHLNKNRVLKQAESRSAMGYYMAYYLEKKFGKGLYEIGQIANVEGGPFSAPDSSYIIVQKYIEKIINPEPVPYDATIMILGKPEPTISLIYVKSKSLGYLALNNIKTLSPKNGKFYYELCIKSPLYLSILTDHTECLQSSNGKKQALANIPKWEEWLNDPGRDVVKEIMSESQDRRLLDLAKNSTNEWLGAFCYFLFLYNAGVNGYDMQFADLARKSIMDEYQSDSKDNRASKLDDGEYYLNRYSNKIIVTDLVQLLWVGTDQEKQEAVKALQEKTGQSFTSAPEWMTWWRANYDKL